MIGVLWTFADEQDSDCDWREKSRGSETMQEMMDWL